MLYDTQIKLLNDKLGFPAKLISLVAAVFMLAISIIIYKAPPLTLIIFAFYAIFYIQIPGLFILKALKVRLDHYSSTLTVGFFAGWSFIILLYFGCNFISNSLLLYIIGPIFSIAYIYSIIKSAKNGQCRTVRLSKISTGLILFATLALAYALLNTQYRYMNPAVADFTYLNADKPFHMGYIMSLADGYPLQSVQVDGVINHYHIFSELLYAICMKLFGLSSDFLLMSAGPFLTAWIVPLSFYSLFKEFTKRKYRAGTYCMILLLSNLYFARSLSQSHAFALIFTNDNAMGYGIASASSSAIILKYWYKTFSDGIKGFGHFFGHPGLYILLILNLIVATGIKGPIGAVIIAGLWGTYIVGLILRKCPTRYILPLLGLTATFLIVYMTILGSKGSSNGSDTSIFAFATLTNISFWKKPLIAFLKSHGIPGIIRLVIILLTFFITFWTIFFLPFVVGYLRELMLVLTGKKGFDYAKVFIYASIFVGIILMMFLNYSGHSQIYFGYISLLWAPLVAFMFIEDMEDNSDSNERQSLKLKLTKAIVVLSTILIVFTACGLTYTYINCIRIAGINARQEQSHSKYLSISNQEYQAMKWLEENTPEDALCANDRYYSVPLSEYTYENRWSSRFFLYAIYSNRFQYIGGSGYEIKTAEWKKRQEMVELNMQLYDVNNEDRGNLARDLGISYVIVSKRFTDAPDLTNKDYKLCFSNDDIDIYEIN